MEQIPKIIKKISPAIVSIILIKPNKEVEEENRERKTNVSFWWKYGDVILVYFFLFIGIFIGYLLLGLALSDSVRFEQVFSFQDNYVLKTKGISLTLLNEFFSTLPPVSLNQVGAILIKNLTVALIAFLLSFLYGASAIFLIVLNSSVFATFIVHIIKLSGFSIAQITKILGIFSLHLIPEVGGFLLAAIAGGVISKVVLSERKNPDVLRRVVRDATKLFIISIALIVVAAFIEVFVSTNLFFQFGR